MRKILSMILLCGMVLSAGCSGIDSKPAVMTPELRTRLHDIQEEYYVCVVESVIEMDDFVTDIERLTKTAMYLCKNHKDRVISVLYDEGWSPYVIKGYSDALYEKVMQNAMFTCLSGRKTKYQVQ